MAKAKEPPLWAPMFSLPNVHVKFPIDVDGFALVAPDDFRIKAIKKQQPRLGSFLKKFKTEFGDPVQPSTIIWRKDKPDTYRTISAISGISRPHIDVGHSPELGQSSPVRPCPGANVFGHIRRLPMDGGQ